MAADLIPFLSPTGFDFADLEPKEVPVTSPERVKLPPGRYMLREASEAAAAMYENARTRATLIDDGKFAGVGDVHDANAVLLGQCLFAVTGEPGRETCKAVGTQTARGVPRRASAAMLAWVKAASGMADPAGDDDGDPAETAGGDDPKGRSPSGTDGSGTATS